MSSQLALLPGAPESPYIRRGRRPIYTEEERKKNQNKYTREWQKKNPQRVAIIIKRWALKNTDKIRAGHLMRKYGLTPAAFDALLERQNGGCAICGSRRWETKRRRLCVDHDKITKTVRGLLCARCNLGLGQFDDNPVLLLRAGEYIGKARAEDWKKQR